MKKLFLFAGAILAAISCEAQWEPDVRLTYDQAVSYTPYSSGVHAVAASGDTIHIVWYDNRDGNYEIYYKRSTDGGTNWEPDTRLTNDPAESSYPSMTVSGSVIHVVWNDTRDGNSEIYYKRNPTGNIGIKNISSEIPKEYKLFPNYPNPFNPMTKIRFDISNNLSFQRKLESSYTTLKIFNILGKEIATLVNKKLQPGTYEVTFDGSNLNSGVYFYHLETDNFTDTKRMLLVK